MVLFMTGFTMSIEVAWASLVLFAYLGLGWEFLRLPFVPMGTIGTAVAFYVGFKNNAAYNRFWEGRIIWGGIVNASRSFANAVLSYHTGAPEDAKELIYRHLAWTNALRMQLRKRSRFAAWREKRARRYDWVVEHQKALRQDWDAELAAFVSAEELAALETMKNPATQLLRTQGERLRELQAAGELDLFRQLELMRIVEELYALQGKCERIKNTPFPRQYAYYGALFTRLFSLLVPLGMLDVFDFENFHIADGGSWVAMVGLVLSSSLVAFVFQTMDFVGDASEDPFEAGMNDVPMNALCRTIEIDLRQMLGETELPPGEQPVGDVLY